ncbi:hypothetical protein D3C75_1055520 [compost metagenome]
MRGGHVGGEEEIEGGAVGDLGVEHTGGRRADDDAVACLGGELLADALYGALEVGGHGHPDFIGPSGPAVQGAGKQTEQHHGQLFLHSLSP